MAGVRVSNFISPSAAFFNCPDPASVSNNFFNSSAFKCRSSFFAVGAPYPLTQSLGFVLLVGFGICFALFTVAIIYLEYYILAPSRRGNSEFFNTAGREAGTGLIASVLVSQWTWAATLLQSCHVAYDFGISGAFWYASAASVQIILFSLLAILVKLRAPTSHTFLEIIRVRWGRSAHIIFICFALLTNVIVTSLLVLGGSAVTNALTGINANLASFLIPLGIMLYTLVGGLKATFIASWINSAIILIAVTVIFFRVYVTSPELGSPDQVWERLRFVASIRPIPNNRGGSYLTILSRDSFFFGLINLVANFSTVFVDQAFWQSAIACTPSSAWTSHMLGGLTWFAIPFSIATALGLGAAALSLPVSDLEANSGLVAPAAAFHLMGKSGAIAIFVMVFSTVTSSGATEMISVSSIISYDIYRTYIDPNSSGPRIIFVSRMAILAYGTLMGLLGIAFNNLQIDLAFMYNAMAVFLSPALMPVIFSISWGRASGKGAVWGALVGLVCGVSAWLGYGASHTGGFIKSNIDQVPVHLVGAMTSLLSSTVVCVGLSLYEPDNCDWSTTRAITLIEDDPNSRLTFETEAELRGAFRKNMIIAVSAVVLLLVVWPLLTIPAGVFSLPYFKLWVYIAMIWIVSSTVILIVLPLWESRRGVVAVASLGYIRLSMLKPKDDFVDDESDDFVADER
jgi:urea-proton symporter